MKIQCQYRYNFSTLSLFKLLVKQLVIICVTNNFSVYVTPQKNIKVLYQNTCINTNQIIDFHNMRFYHLTFLCSHQIGVYDRMFCNSVEISNQRVVRQTSRCVFLLLDILQLVKSIKST